MHDMDITLYNRVKGADYDRDIYHATVLRNVSVKHEYEQLAEIADLCRVLGI